MNNVVLIGRLTKDPEVRYISQAGLRRWMMMILLKQPTHLSLFTGIGGIFTKEKRLLNEIALFRIKTYNTSKKQEGR